jgi:hypothetical protein
MDTMAEWSDQLVPLLARMDAISVREDSGGRIVQSISGRDDAVTVVDPTLLLTADVYRKQWTPREHTQSRLFSYILHGQDADAEPVIARVAAAMKLPVDRCNLAELTVGKGYVRSNPVEWLRRIDEAGFVVTNSFHGVIFCLLLHTPFVVLPVSGKKSTMNSRVTELLERAGLRERLIAFDSTIFESLMMQGIDWDSVDQKIEKSRLRGKTFLAEQLQI